MNIDLRNGEVVKKGELRMRAVVVGGGKPHDSSKGEGKGRGCL